MDDITRILDTHSPDDDRSAEALLPLVYEELRKLAAARMATMPASHTLQPTALVHEAWVKMVGTKDRTWHNRAFFFAAASKAMRDILVDHARKRAAKKRGGGRQRLRLDDLELSAPMKDEFVLLLEDALVQLEELNPKWATIVVRKFYGGMTNREVSEEMGVSESTIERHWAGAKAWLLQQIMSNHE